MSFNPTRILSSKLLGSRGLMTNFGFSPPELLEARIAPAGLITATFSHNLLTINGTDGANHTFTIVKTGSYTFSVEGNATDVNVLGQASESFRGTLNSVDIEGGSGADTVFLTDLSPLKSLIFNGNGGADSLSTSNLRTALGGFVDISFASGTGAANFSGSRTSVHGHLNINLGNGGSAGFSSAITTIGGDAAITGTLGADSVAISGPTTLFKSNLSLTGGSGDVTFDSTGKSFSVLGSVNMLGGAGNNNFDFAATTTRFGTHLLPTVALNLGAGPGMVTFAGTSNSVYGDLVIDLGTGGGTANLNSTVTTVSRNVQVIGGPGNDTLDFSGRASIAENLSFVGNGGNDAFTATGSLLSVKGATSMDGSEGVNTLDLNVRSLALGSLTFTGGPQNDNVSIIANGTISGDTILNLGIDGTGPSSTTLQSFTGVANGLKLGGLLNITMNGATVDALTIANIQIAKGLVAQTGNDGSTVNISGLNTPADFNLQTGIGVDTVNISNINTRDFTLDTGSGADVVNIDNFHVRNFNVNTGIGADVLSIENNPAYLGTSQVLGTATILTGIGADNILIGNASSPANTKVFFMGPVTVDAGDGANTINDIVACNFFALTPTIIATGGTLTTV